MKVNLKKDILNILVYRFNLDEDKAREEEIVESLSRNVEFKGTNLWALIFAIFIASIGLNVNSTAVIIGAMLISPLMGPIMGVGLGAGIFDFKLIRFSLKNLFIAVIISLLTSALYFWLTPIHVAQSELLARTTPTLWDVLIAFFGGLAGIIASSRKNISNTIPGVAIATALMPPLCTAGYGIGTGNLYYFAGAFYLFLINSVFISIATFLIVRFLKFKPRLFVDDATETKVRRYIWGIAILTILPSAYLAYRFVTQEIFKQNVQHFIKNEIENNNLYTINRNINAGNKTVNLLIYGDSVSDRFIKKVLMNKDAYGLQDADINIRSTINQADISTVKQDFDVNLRALSERDIRIKTLEAKVSSTRLINDSAFYKEFTALFGDVNELSLNESILYGKDAARDTIYLLYIKPVKRIKDTEPIKNWVIARYKKRNVKVTFER